MQLEEHVLGNIARLLGIGEQPSRQAADTAVMRLNDRVIARWRVRARVAYDTAL